MERTDVLSKLKQFSAQKWDGVSEISPKYPSMKSSWGSKYFTSQRGAQCPLPKVVLYYRSLLSNTCWQTSEKKSLIATVENVLRLTNEENLNQKRGEEAKGETEDLEEAMEEGNVDDCLLNWDEICKNTKFVKKKSARECLMQYRNICDPSINHDEWTEEERMKLQDVVRLYQEHDWCSIADAVGNNRTPLQCLQTYQVRLNKKAINTTEWTAEEDQILEQAVALYGNKNWQHVANCLPGRSANHCHSRWRQESRAETAKSGKWSDLEERKLICAVLAFGEKTLSPQPSQQSLTDSAEVSEEMGVERIKKRPEQRLWMKISHHVPGRDEIKCREKWMNVLDPQLNTKPFTPEEDLIILRETASLPPVTDTQPQPTQSNLESDGIYSTGANWAAIAALLPGRTDNHVWRRWKELNGKVNADVYKESSRKRKAINPALRSRAKATKVDQRNYQLVLSIPQSSPATDP